MLSPRSRLPKFMGFYSKSLSPTSVALNCTVTKILLKIHVVSWAALAWMLKQQPEAVPDERMRAGRNYLPPRRGRKRVALK